ncbi:fibrinogen-like protein 1 [Alosa alosa]|uniref:fibrinogen-like protein 1 n=1 Tax=Alosa alosa TaxID=278164 RepID=UPI00201505F4|nr:fibrinogen-like protein 1 [Alosa alosa]
MGGEERRAWRAVPRLSPLRLTGTLLLLCVAVRVAGGDGDDYTQRVSQASQCGEYSNQLQEDGTCRLVATLPQMDEQRCPDMFRCTDEVAFWLRENEERKQQILTLKETVSELQEELRNHRHRVKVLELQSEERNRVNSSLEQRVHELEEHYAEASTVIDGAACSRAEEHYAEAFTSPAPRRDRDQRETAFSDRADAARQVQHVRNCPIDCASIYYNGVRRSGVFTVVPSLGATPVEVYCDMETDGGGWTVIQHRQDGSVNFDRSWTEYKEGFGDLHTEYWLGNSHIHDLTSQGDYTLRIDLEDWSSKHKYALYQSFSIEDEATQYRLHVSGYSGTAEDSFSWYHDKQGFSTPDTGNVCAEISHAGWWYNQCFYANLNGVYYKGGRYSPKAKNPLGPDGIVWFTWKDSDYYSLRRVSMMIRPRTFRPHLSP